MNDVPTNWGFTSLNNESLFSFENGTWTGKKLPLIECSVVRNTNFTNEGTFDFSNVAVIPIEKRELERKKLQRGDIVIERSGGGPTQPVGRVAFFDLDTATFCFSNFTSRLRVKKREVVDPYFVHLFLLGFHWSGKTEPLQRRTTGIRNLVFSDYKAITVPLPPLPEQRAIAAALRTVQDAQDARRRELALERERKAALMQQLFTYGTRGEPLKETSLGMLPENWKLERIDRAYKTQLGKMLSPKSKVGASPKPYLRNSNVQWGRIDMSEVFTMDFDERESAKYLLKYGDVLICEGGEIGRTAIWQNLLPECYFQKAIHRLRPTNSDTEPMFLAHFLEYAFRNRKLYKTIGTETTIAHLPQDKLNALQIPTPCACEQREIAAILTACDDKIAALDREIILHEELFKALLEELMSGRLSTIPLIESGLVQ